MKKKGAYLLVGVSLLMICLVAGYNYLYQDHRDITAEQPFAQLDTAELKTQMELGEGDLLIDETLVITGKVTEVSPEAITLDHVVFCSLSATAGIPNVGDRVSVKGRCLGYDELFGLVKLDQCNIVNKDL